MLFPKLLRTLGHSAQEKKVLDTKVQPSTGSFPTSCARAEILLIIMALEVRLKISIFDPDTLALKIEYQVKTKDCKCDFDLRQVHLWEQV